MDIDDGRKPKTHSRATHAPRAPRSAPRTPHVRPLTLAAPTCGTSEGPNSSTMPRRVLCVAEKNSVASEVARVMNGGRPPPSETTW